jgi:hypothetical protein
MNMNKAAGAAAWRWSATTRWCARGCCAGTLAPASSTSSYLAMTSPAGCRPPTPRRSPSRPHPRWSGRGWVQIGNHRAGFYSYDWVERFIFPGTVHYAEGTHSATRIQPELQDVHIGDRINTGSVGKFAVGNPVTLLQPG